MKNLNTSTVLVESDVRALTNDLRDAHAAYHHASTRELRIVESLSTARETLARRRLELGKLLISARERWPASGPRAKGWGQLLAAAGIDQDVALLAMKYAGYVAETFPGDDRETMDGRMGARLPTLQEAGLAKPRLELVPNEPDIADWDVESAVDDHEPEIDRDTWCTPQWLAEAIGPWDLDPCSNERSHVKAKHAYRLDRDQDGLQLAAQVRRDQRVFINPPYSDVMPWVEAYRRTRFCFLLKIDPSTKWFSALYEYAGAILVPRGTRIQFEAPPGVPPEKAQANQFPHGLFYASENDVTPAVLDACFSPWRTKP